MSENAYREAAEMPPEPPKPKKPSWISEMWKKYVSMLSSHPMESHLLGLLLIMTIVLLIFSVDTLIGSAYRSWRDPCAEYVFVPQPAQTVDGTPVTIQVKKCLRLK